MKLQAFHPSNFIVHLSAVSDSSFKFSENWLQVMEGRQVPLPILTFDGTNIIDNRAMASRVFTLTPCEKDSVLNFDRDWTQLKEQPLTNHEHHRLFVHVEAEMRAIRSILQCEDDDIPSTDTDATVQTQSDDPMYTVVQTDCYVLSLNHGPIKHPLGRVLGSGRDQAPSGGVDFILSKERGINSSHISFKYNNFGQLCLVARHGSVSLDGTCLVRQEMTPLPRAQHIIRVGHLAFRFDYVVPRELEEAHQNAKNAYLQGKPQYQALVSATPRETDVFFGEWKLHGVAGAGVVSVINAASHTKRNELVAIKTIVRHDIRSSLRASAEVNLYKNIKDSLRNIRHSDYVMQLQEVLYQTQAIWANGHPDTIWLLYSPLGIMTYAQVCQRRGDFTRETRVALFASAVMGLSGLHTAGWIHRDIKPGNLVVVSLDPPRGFVIDLERATTISSHQKQRQGKVGTPGYLAPELENSEFATGGQEYYNEAVDAWSLGAVGLGLLMSGNPWRGDMANCFRAPVDWTRIVARAGLLPEIEALQQNTVEFLITAMVRMKPHLRPTALQALAYPILREVVEKLAVVGEKRQRIE